MPVRGGEPPYALTVSISIRCPSPSQLDRLRLRLAEQPLTYRQPGATAGTAQPSGYHHDRTAVPLGTGVGLWDAAKQALVGWKAHENAGVAVAPTGAPLSPGTVVTATARVGPLWVVAPCRIVYVTDEPDRFGFAYGTLPGHPEEGEEAFHVVLAPDGALLFEIVAFSRPAALLARLGGPISRGVQRRATRRYLDGMKQEVAAAPDRR